MQGICQNETYFMLHLGCSCWDCRKNPTILRIETTQMKKRMREERNSRSNCLMDIFTSVSIAVVLMILLFFICTVRPVFKWKPLFKSFRRSLNLTKCQSLRELSKHIQVQTRMSVGIKKRFWFSIVIFVALELKLSKSKQKDDEDIHGQRSVLNSFVLCLKLCFDIHKEDYCQPLQN